MAPPRAAPVQAAKPVAQGRSVKKVPVQVPPAQARTFLDTIRQPDVKETCPLCIEDLDETDKDFYPCPCGYQVCLFCYGKLKEKCNSMCPNCRREYGAPVDAPTVRQLAAEELAMEAASRSSSGNQMQRPGAAHQNGGQAQPAMSAAPVQGSSRPTPASKPDTAAQQQRRAQDTQAAAGYSKRMDAVAALPTGATWAAGGQVTAPRHTPLSDIEHPSQQQAQHQQPTAVDSSAWPSLADSTSTAAAAAPMQPRQARHDHSQSFQSMETASSNQSHHLRSASASSASAEGMHSRSSSSQDLQQELLHATHHPLPPAFPSSSHTVPPHLMDAFATAQVSSTVHGVRHSINVPLLLNNSTVHPHPDAAALRASLQQAVKSGAMSSREAAGRLMALLRQASQAEAEHGGSARSLLAAGKLPPGFGPPAPLASALHPATLYPQPSASGVNHLDPSISRPQLGKFRPIQPPIHNGNSLLAGAPGRQQQQQQQQGFTFVSNGTQQQQQARDRAYSMWSGLPGLELELNAGLSEWQAQGLGLQYCNGVSSGHQLNPPPGMRQEPQLSFPPSSMPTASTPPPGFGATAYAAGPRPYDPTPTASFSAVGDSSAAPNPLQAQLAGLSRPPPPGMTAYRPQL